MSLFSLYLFSSYQLHFILYCIMSTRRNPPRGDRVNYATPLDIGVTSESDNDQAGEWSGDSKADGEDFQEDERSDSSSESDDDQEGERSGDSEADGEDFQEDERAESSSESKGVDDGGNLDKEDSYAESIPSIQGTDSAQGVLTNCM